MSKYDIIIKRIFDIITSFLGLVVLSPLFVFIYFLIKIKMNDGPVLFKQSRIGKGGKIFILVKFRSMCINHNGNSVSVVGQSRITPLGAKLRKFKLDELPELWNVLVGDMSLVGPRPDVPGYADQLKGPDKEVLKLRPGITGPASLKYRNEEELLALQIDPKEYNDKVIFPDKVKINNYYLCNYSFFKDIQMIFCTIFGFKMKYANEII